MTLLELKIKVKKLQKRTESWDINEWSLEQIQNKVNGIFKRTGIVIEEIHITPHTLEVRYFEKPNDTINPSKRS